tara:strand:+ start:856 stop:1269 length:414 start_codon:yes stop_codon:yes gene_type:complete
MDPIKKTSESLEDLTNEQIADIVRANEALDEEEARLVKEDREEEDRQEIEKRAKRHLFNRIRKSPLEIINRLLFFVFLGGFFFSFVSAYASNTLFFVMYIISAFSCILYTPNRKALKELIAAWPNIVDLIKGRSLWK